MPGASHFPPAAPHGCPRENSADSSSVQRGFDALELQLLDLMRLQFAERAGQRPRHGAGAVEVAQLAFGATRAPRLVAAISAMIDHMARARGATFRFSNPYCSHCVSGLTAEERHFLMILHQLRRGHRGAAMVEALMICEAGPIDGLIESASALACLTAEVG